MLSIGAMSGCVGYGVVDQMPSEGCNQAHTSIIGFARCLLADNLGVVVPPSNGGRLKIDKEHLGNFEYAVRNSELIDASWKEEDYFSQRSDNVSSWVIFNGDVTFDISLTENNPFRPSKRKLFTVLFVTGNLTIDGCISMTARGANHSGTGESGGFTAPANIKLANGLFIQNLPQTEVIKDPCIPANGGSGAIMRECTQGDGFNCGENGICGGTGGGGGGTKYSNGGNIGAGSSGTCFSGGCGSGTVFLTSGCDSSVDAVGNGGSGGPGVQTNSMNCPGGAGNPGGQGYRYGSDYDEISGGNGTGGVLIIICEGVLTVGSAAQVTANGVDGGSLGDGIYGGGSGGGSINVFTKSIAGAPLTMGAYGGRNVGGGNGTARLFILPVSA